MDEPRWYLKIEGKWVYSEDGAIKAHEFNYAEAFTFIEAAHVAGLLRAFYPDKLIESRRCNADEFALPENMRKIINA
ncbi:hypothetical protein F406_gp038 [Agrobacterium phage 7-7-1]|uniref:Uncharacterized protein n=1 Tax=Agrobacterium phage 7-7-1 TaxID=1161931 RepID=J7F9F4_9CAUD|nr:hypothetical protein F406_gp038 [Agrobacterium phage 7-7-1]AFH19777.1 hypothetical protein 7-7-1_00079 [Agrobacterium phage 7-7-1]